MLSISKLVKGCREGRAISKWAIQSNWAAVFKAKVTIHRLASLSSVKVGVCAFCASVFDVLHKTLALGRLASVLKLVRHCIEATFVNEMAWHWFLIKSYSVYL